MATSGSINLTATALDIIKEALEQVGAIEEGSTPSTAQQTSSLRTLNYMVKAWQAEGINLFAIQKVTLFLSKSGYQYTMNTSGANATTSYVQTALSAAGAASDGTITVDSITGISDGDYIGIELSDGTMQWTTVNGAPSGSTITLTTALTGAASDGAVIYAYTTKANRPMKIINAVRSDSAGNEIPLDFYTLDEYIDMPNKTDTGPVNSIYYDPQVSSPVLYTWPASDSATDRLVLWTQRTLEDLDATTDAMDYPQEWFLALSLNLAVLLSGKYGLSRAEKQEIMGLADYFKELAEGYDREDLVSMIPEDNN